MVPESFIEVIRDRLAKFNRRMVKKGLPSATLLLTGATETRRECRTRDIRGCHGDSHAPWCSQVLWVEVDMSAPDVKHAGWHLVSSVDDVDGKPIFRTVPGRLIIDERFRTIDPNTCDHCNKSRRRSETFIIGHEDGHEMIIGRQCIRDYLGWDIGPLVSYWSDFDRLSEDDGDGSYGSYVQRSWTVDQVLMAASQAVAVDGFYFKSDHDKATKGTVMTLLSPPRNKYDEEEHAKYASMPDKAQKIFDATKIALESVDANKGEWQYNLSILRNADRITSRHIGILASAVILGLRAIEETPYVKREAQERPIKAFYGKVGDKVSLTVAVVRTNEFQGNYGYTTIITMTDGDHDFTWFASGSHPVVAGDVLDISGTVKAHDTYSPKDGRVTRYDGSKSTVLTRCKYIVTAHAQEA